MLVKWGEINRNIAQGLLENEDYFVKLIQRVMPKSDKQCRGEVIVTRKFFENFAGDNVRFLMKGNYSIFHSIF
jgi:1-pyrroline-5-carboxylate dehydrogenase